MKSRLMMMAAALATASAPAMAQIRTAPLVGITQAVATAEKALSANAMEAELDTRGGRLVYEVDLMRGDTLLEALIDARTGKLVSATKPRFGSFWQSWFDFDVEAFSRSARPLAPRLAALERESGGRVQEVGFDADGGMPLYEVEIATQAGVAEVYIDVRNGERLAMNYDD